MFGMPPRRKEPSPRAWSHFGLSKLALTRRAKHWQNGIIEEFGSARGGKHSPRAFRCHRPDWRSALLSSGIRSRSCRKKELTLFPLCSKPTSGRNDHDHTLRSIQIEAVMSTSFLALVLLERPVTPDMVALAEAVRRRHPELATEIDVGASDVGQGSDGGSVLRCGDQLIVVMSMPAPIPQDPGLWSRATTAWPEANTVAARHRGHLLVSVVGQNQTLLSEARLMTAVIGALIATVAECRAVVWDTKVARPADLWLDLSRQSFAPFPDYPFPLWVDVLPFRTRTGIGAVTMGLTAFVDREIQFETSRLPLDALLERVEGLVVYLIEHGRVLKDGDTFGGDANERIAVRYKNSDQFGMPVFFCTDGSS
ncbi:DUF4261 domain-containing protein [Bradyrhizobium campsiandrae]|nr:DUF4261 domain-containing protein [Bradyrhizobium campsiandrae]